MHNWWNSHLVLERNLFLSVICVLPVLGGLVKWHKRNVSFGILMLTRRLQFTCLWFLWSSFFPKHYLVQPSRPLAQPLAWPIRPSTLSRTLSWALSVSACWLYEVQWTAQIAWGVENSFVTRTLLSAKARWSFTMDTLSMWNCFFSQETHGFAPTFMAHTMKWPVSRWKQAQITFLLVLPIFLPSLFFTLVLVYFPTIWLLGNCSPQEKGNYIGDYSLSGWNSFYVNGVACSKWVL